MLGVILVVIAIVLVVVDIVGHRSTDRADRWLLPLAVLLVCLALLVGVDPPIQVGDTK